MRAILPILDENGNRPYYLQLYDYIRDAILAGDIMEGEKLPSLRSLAKSTGLSITTIKQAYDQLLVEGYVYSKAQSGYYAAEVFSHSQKTVPPEKSIFSPQMFSMEKELSAGCGMLKYDPACFDFNKWKKCMNKILTEYPSALFFESDPQGEAVLRAQIAKYLYLSRGVSCQPSQIIIGAGTQQITNQLATILRRLGIEHVALETPGYIPVKNIFRDRGFAITPVGLDKEGLMIEKLPANIRTAAYVSPSNHVLTGEVMPVGKRYELLNWASRNDSYIIEDDYDSELRYFGRPVPALKSLESNDRVIYLGSFSSTLFTAVKISYMVLPIKMAELFSSMAQDYTQTCSKLEQLTLAMFMETGNYQTHIKKLRKLYAQKLAAVTDIFAAKAAGFIRMRNTASGISVILQIIETGHGSIAALAENKHDGAATSARDAGGAMASPASAEDSGGDACAAGNTASRIKPARTAASPESQASPARAAGAPMQAKPGGNPAQAPHTPMQAKPGGNPAQAPHAPDLVRKLKQEADAAGLPVTILDEDLLMFYYNHIPLSEISPLLSSLIDSWAAIAASSALRTS